MPTCLITEEEKAKLRRGETIQIVPARPGYRVVFDGTTLTNTGAIVGWHYEAVDSKGPEA